MSLANLKLPTTTVTIGGEAVEFNGISFNDLTKLISDHKDDLDMILVEANKFMSNPEHGSIQQLVVTTLVKLPDLCSHIIALAAGEPEMVKAAKQIPFPTQVQILNDVFALTFSEVGGVGKFVELVTIILSSTNDLIDKKVTTGITS